MRKSFTKEEIEFLYKNYPPRGTKFCAEKLNRTMSSINNKCLKLKLITRGIRKKLAEEYKVNPTQFMVVTTPITAYILGLLWADGCIQSPYNIILATTYPDAEHFMCLFSKTGKWNIYSRNPKNINHKKICKICTSNKMLADFLLQNDYKVKSNCSADKILSIIPNNLKNYWVRGLFDGDGHLYTNKNGSHKIGFSSSYNQDWSYLKHICNNLNIPFSIHKHINKKNHSQSSFCIYGMYRVIKFCEFMYDGYPNDNIGLKRKYNKLLELKKIEEKNRYKGVCLGKNNKWRTYTSAANGNKPKSLGEYDTKEEAEKVVKEYYNTHQKIYLN